MVMLTCADSSPTCTVKSLSPRGQWPRDAFSVNEPRKTREASCMRSWVGLPLFSKTTPHRQPGISVVPVIFSPSQPLNRKRARTRIYQREKVSGSN
jgi:hypothetical protein